MSLALRGDGTVLAWGDNREGQTANVPATTNVVAIATGGYHASRCKPTGPWWRGDSTTMANLTCRPVPPTSHRSPPELLTVRRARGWNGGGVGQRLLLADRCPGSATNVVAITAGGFRPLALRRDPASQLRPRIWQAPVDRTVLVPQAVASMWRRSGRYRSAISGISWTRRCPAQTNRWLEFQSVQTNQAGRTMSRSPTTSVP